MRIRHAAPLPTLLALVLVPWVLVPHHSSRVAGSPGMWTVTGNMTIPRAGHTATLLPDGDVLVTGGSNPPDAEYSSGAELYHPSSGMWTATASMSVARAEHTATLLQNGKVLVAGGVTDSGGGASAELYDPNTRTWTATGSMTTARSGHTATLLPDGRVLVIGGTGRDGVLSSAELYDPNSGTWTSAGTTAVARLGHSATLLPNGKVLVAGGAYYSDLQSLASAQLYDPKTNAWTATGSMQVGRSGHIAVLLPNGKVLVAGGSGDSSAELYDPATGLWTSTSSMTSIRTGATATLLATGQVLVAGGVAVRDSIASAEVYEPLGGVWTSVGAMHTPRVSFTATLLSTGQVLAAGGTAAGNYWVGEMATAELYTPAPRPPITLSSSRVAFGNLPISGPSAAVAITVANSNPTTVTISTVAVTGSARLDYAIAGTCSGMVLVPGATCIIYVRFTPSALGIRRAQVLVTDSAATSPQSIELVGRGLAVTGPNTWTVTGAMRMARADHTATLLRDGQVLVVGGIADSPFIGINPNRALVSGTAERYDPRTGRWTRTADLSVPRVGHTATLLPNDDVLVAGGEENNGVYSAELFDPRHGTWIAVPDMLEGRGDHGAVLLPTGEVLVAGGCCGYDAESDASDARTSPLPLSTAEVYDPRKNRWNRTSDMVNNPVGALLTLLPNGKVLAIGSKCPKPCYNYSGDSQLYDPVAGLWSPAAALDRAHGTVADLSSRVFTVTLLRDGRVLVAGGLGANGAPTNEADLYNPLTNSWSATGPMTTARTHHTATLLPNGTVLVVGGCGDLPNCLQPLASAETYDPSAGTWTPVGNLHVARFDHTATLLRDGQVLVSGGVGDKGHPLASAELYTSLALTATPQSALANQTVTVAGVNFSPLEVVSLYWNKPGTYPLATVTTGKDGSFVARLRLPRDRRGRHLIYAVGRRSQAPVSVRVTVG